MRQKIEKLISKLPPSEAIALLESISKNLRRKNSIRINEGQMGRRVDERPDEGILKHG
jgi:hypothetical protein